jgi:ABC-type multidrug transport system fused ATPase/permease subunit
MFYFETTPIGRLLNRFTYDAEILDVTLVWSMSMLLISSSWFIAAVVIMVAILPWIFFFLIPICIIYITIHRLYRKSGADLQRLDALSRSPLQTMLVEAIEGSPTIRIFQKEKVFMRRFEDFADKSTMAQMNYIVAQRWLGVRIELLGTAIVFCTILFIITSWGMEFFTLDAGMVALVIRWSGGVTISLSFLCDNAAEAEGAITAIERIQQILLIPQELNFSKTNIDDSWPEKGVVEFRDVKMRYRPKLPLSLNGLSFRVQAGEHCGVVGRTGAGKSSILTALFRLVEIDGGSITIDGVDLSKIGLSDIRGRPNGISIIPQDPILFAGTMRECLDPFGLSTDNKLVDALESVRMLSPGTSTEILDSRIEEGGTNYSVGQRSLLVLARAMLAKPKVLLLDEATGKWNYCAHYYQGSNVTNRNLCLFIISNRITHCLPFVPAASIDGETDKFIQQMLRTRFLGTTLLTIAHRLDTIIDYDKVLVLSNGRAVEFGTPIDLIENNQLFAELINATGEGAASLIEMAQDAKMMRSRRKTTI